MKKAKILSLAAVALLAVAPVATTVTSLSTVQVAQAAELTPDQLMQSYYDSYDGNDRVIKLNKKTPFLSAYNGQTVASLKRKGISDVTSNYGHVSKLDSLSVYKAFDNGRPDFGKRIKEDQKLNQNENYVAALRFKLNSVKPYVNDDGYDEDEYTYFSQEHHDFDEDLTSDYTFVGWGIDDDSPITLLVPVHVNPAPAETPVHVNPAPAETYASIKARRNHKVRTYTSSGKFSRHYVYGKRTYRVNSKKKIKHRGTCYKLYGKNQWIPAKYLDLR
ncbi:hypothetical protein ERJ65_08065 [Lactobacillus helveticus]|uniref:Surface layer protein A domain-containing protein n=2 Tax=Lactobacillus helveticus TaxID=1587 RepID=A0AAV4E6F9_LACHE|nr:hypothetical protein [Lactobacillus helveticus]AGQ23125.1 hypothetical protein lhe_0573 [Lactobacillus helveticus CNRZ32]KXN80255.1 hypothetical protein AY471_04505 [Lactobacillus helveticus]MBW7979947.1 hypothetical protein [Lactobacillus helveticus]MBW7999492.1 hypothetical protein [Lactobacillus helveticus]MBW8062881.1 hypothetical protein [Lactobacillus helveticus]